MNLKDILEMKFPNECEQGLIKCNNEDTSIEEGWYIGTWEVDFPLPSKEDLDKWAIEFKEVFEIKQAKIEFEKRNAFLLEKLKDIDLKSIRSLRENNVDKIRELELEAALIRSQFE